MRATAADRDRAGRHQDSEIGWLKNAELLGILVPSEDGGGDASWAEVSAVIRRSPRPILDRPRAALSLLRQPRGHPWREWLHRTPRARRIAKGQLFHGTIAQAAYQPLILATQTTGGFRLPGTKPFTSGAALADVLLTWVVFDAARSCSVPMSPDNSPLSISTAAQRDCPSAMTGTMSGNG